ncbi:MAG: hypothetical protein NWS53_00375 [Salibacteraceae bacterium]|nr:hypothetical protein [Salibacteraceae bacterium]
MKNQVFTLLLAVFMCITANAQTNTNQNKLQAIVQTTEINQFFDGLFDKLGIKVIDTKENLTLVQEGGKIIVNAGLVDSEVDFILELESRNIDNVERFTSDGKIDAEEATAIAGVFFTPFTKSTLKNPILSANSKRKAAKIDDLTHVKLVNSKNEVIASHTLVYAAKQWLVFEGLVGNPQRVFTLNADSAMVYQKQVSKAIKIGSNKGWLTFLKWWKGWREENSVKM